jgi:oligosaccharyltransferase complex subunit epsilon
MAPKAKQAAQQGKAQAVETADAVSSLWAAYANGTPARLKFVDAFLAFLVLSGVIQFAYCVLVTNFPFNAFLAGYVSLNCMGCKVC